MSTLSLRGNSEPGGSLALEKVLLACGVASSAYWILSNEAVAANLYQGYSRVSQTISELSALDAPSRPTLFPLLVAYGGLVIAYGVGVSRAARGRRSLRTAGGLLVAGGILELVGLAFPLTGRLSAVAPGTALPMSDTIHNILNGGLGPPLMLVTIGFGAAGLGRRFRIYSVLSGLAILGGGVLMMIGGPQSNWLGAAERISAWAWMGWLAAFGIALLRRLPHAARFSTG